LTAPELPESGQLGLQEGISGWIGIADPQTVHKKEKNATHAITSSRRQTQAGGSLKQAAEMGTKAARTTFRPQPPWPFFTWHRVTWLTSSMT
jgi:hypothetical protein